MTFVDDGLDFGRDNGPELSLMHREFTDSSLASPTPSILLGLANQSVCLYDLGVSSGMAFGRDWIKHPVSRKEYDEHAEHMLRCLDAKRPHLFRTYAEGWINGYDAVKLGVIA